MLIIVGGRGERIRNYSVHDCKASVAVIRHFRGDEPFKITVERTRNWKEPEQHTHDIY